jgi:hypothetical protein
MGCPPTVRYRVADPTPYGKMVYGRRDVRDQVTGDWPPIPYTDQGESGAYRKSLGLKGPSDSFPGESLSFPLLDRQEYSKDYSTDYELLNYPLRGWPRFSVLWIWSWSTARALCPITPARLVRTVSIRPSAFY